MQFSFRFRLTLIILFCFGLLHTANSQTTTRHPLIEWEDLPLIRTGVKLKTYVSAHPGGITFKDFQNYPGRIDGDYQLAIQKGQPGMLVYIWFTQGFYRANNLNLFFDKLSSPSISESQKNYFYQSNYPHLQPLWGNHNDQEMWGFPLLSFDSVFQATRTGKPDWYQFGVHLYREPRFSEALTSSEIEQVNEKMQQPTGAFPGSDQGDQINNGISSLAPSETKTIFSTQSPGVIRSIRFTPSSTQPSMLDHIYIRLQADGETTAYLPVTMFFMGYVDVSMTKAKSMAAGYDGANLYFYLPMPFWSSFSIELENRTGQSIQLPFKVNWNDVNPYPEDRTGKLFIKYNRDERLNPWDLDFQHLQTSGSGQVVGVVGTNNREIESDFRVYVDGSKTPAFQATGRSDFFCQSFGVDENLQTKFHGGLKPDMAGYRLFLADYIPFQNSISFGEGHGEHEIHEDDGNYTSAVFYYYRPQPTLILTDSLDVGDVTSEQAHEYTINGSKGRLQTDTGDYGGNYHKQYFTDSGRWTNGSSSFIAFIDPNNDGVRLRKRIDQRLHHQSVKVLVDGVDAGIWFEQGANYYVNEQPDWGNSNFNSIFRDTEFEIPAELTAGKSSIKITMETIDAEAIDNADDGLTNEYFYWAYSYVNESDDPIVIDPVIRISSPDGGERWIVGNQYPVKWFTYGEIPSVRLELSYDAGLNWQTIVDSLENDGEYLWTAADSVSDQCKIRITDVANDSIFDVSDDVFAIVPFGSKIAARLEIDPYNQWDSFIFRAENKSETAAIISIRLTGREDDMFDMFNPGSYFTVTPDLKRNNDQFESKEVILTFPNGLRPGFGDENDRGNDIDGTPSSLYAEVQFDNGSVLTGGFTNERDSDDADADLWVFDAFSEGLPDTTAPNIKNVNVSKITAGSAEITWETDEPSYSQVDYDQNMDYKNSTPLIDSLLENHKVQLTGLLANTVYYFRIRSMDLSGNEAIRDGYSFQTKEAGSNLMVHIELDPYNQWDAFTFRVSNRSDSAAVTSIMLTGSGAETFDMFIPGRYFLVQPDLKRNNDEYKTNQVFLEFLGNGLAPGLSDENGTGSDLDDPIDGLIVQVDFSDGRELTGTVRLSEDNDDGNPDLWIADLSSDLTKSNLDNDLSAKILSPQEFSISQNYPNPVNGETIFEYQLPVKKWVVIKIYDLTGKETVSLEDGYKEPGNHQIVWNGKDKFGNDVSSGVYFYKMSAGDFTQFKKLIFVK